MKFLDILRKIDADPEKSAPSTDTASSKAPQENSSTDEKSQNTDQKNEVVEEKAEEKEQLPVTTHDKRVNIEEQMDQLSHHYAQLRNDLKTNLFSEKDEHETKKDTLDNYLGTLKRDQKESNEKLADIKAQNDDAETERLAGVHADQKEQNELLDNFKTQQQELSDKISDNQSKLSNAQDELTKNEQSEADMSSSIKEEKDLQKMMVLMEEQKKSIDKLYKEREDIQSKINDIKATIDSLQTELDETNKNINGTSSNIDMLKSKANQIEDKIKNDRNYRIETKAGLERHLQSLADEREKIESELEEVNGNIDYLGKYIKDVFHSAYLVRDVYLDKDKDYYVTADSFETESQQRDVFDMVQFLEAKLQKPVTLVSTFYNNHLNELVDHNAKLAKVHIPNVVSLFDQLQASPNPTDKTVEIPENDGWVTRTDVKSHDTVIYDQGNTLLMTVEYDNTNDDKKIDRINYYKNDQVVKANIYNAAGQLSSVQNFNKEKVLTEQNFYRTDGSIVLTIIFEDSKPTSYQLFDKNGLLEHDFNSKAELITWWLESISPDTQNAIFVGSIDDQLYQLIIKEDKLDSDQTISLLQNVSDNIENVIKSLDKNQDVTNILVQFSKDLHAIESETNRDISVSVIRTSNSSNLALPESLEI
ncbi:coiled-coil domain-containing protein [Companilactobacillus jidongensis]|uniref:hypothetical protein n=1 Tax=Companilactobacillus jidongensis TaxID=2486006 RepID=UPI000F7A9BA6|nr:hypothetical protein [Companilactobacillus jidongensis]